MDQQLLARFQLYEREHLAATPVVNFVHEAVQWLEKESTLPATEETAGPLAAHLLAALERVRRGEPIGEAWSPDVHAEAATLRELTPWAEHIAQRAKSVLRITLPPEEQDFLLLHLGAFVIHNGKHTLIPDALFGPGGEHQR